jgi:hypothetical protein
VRRALAILVFGGVANAQPAPPPDGTPADTAQVPVQAPAPTPAEQLFIDGRALLESGEFEAACEKFEASVKLDPAAPGTLLNLGLCNERLGKTATALSWFRRAQFRAAETGMTDYEDVAKNNTFSLAVRVPTLTITFAKPPPEGWTLAVDGNPIAEVDLGHVEVDPHVKHVVELQTKGNPPVTTEVTLKDGETKPLVLDVPGPVVAARPPPPEKVYVEVDRGRTRRLVAYGVAGVGVALWGASLYVSLDAKDKLDNSEHPEDWQHYENVARWGGTSLFVGGALAIAGAGVLYFTAPGIERVERTAFAPVVSSDQLGVMVHGAF